MKTVTHKGKVYQLNSLYELHDGTKVVLDSSNGQSFRVSRLDVPEDFWYTEELHDGVSVNIGTIEDAPLELESDQWYMCEVNEALGGTYPKPLFHQLGDWFEFDVSGSDAIPRQTKITAEYKMVKAS